MADDKQNSRKHQGGLPKFVRENINKAERERAREAKVKKAKKKRGEE